MVSRLVVSKYFQWSQKAWMQAGLLPNHYKFCVLCSISCLFIFALELILYLVETITKWIRNYNKKLNSPVSPFGLLSSILIGIKARLQVQVLQVMLGERLLVYRGQRLPRDSLPRGHYRKTYPRDIGLVFAQPVSVYGVCIVKPLMSTHCSVVGLCTTIVNYS